MSERMSHLLETLRIKDTKQIVPIFETGILGLGHYQQEISDRQSLIIPFIDNFGFWPDSNEHIRQASHISKSDCKHSTLKN
jgi:hypothetical protein